jgi:hypothetical protein
VYINDLPFSGDTQVVLAILSSCVVHQPSYVTWTIFSSSSFLYLLASFDKNVMHVSGDIMCLVSWESFQGLLVRCQIRLVDIHLWHKPSFYRGLCPIYFSRKLGSSGSTFLL